MISLSRIKNNWIYSYLLAKKKFFSYGFLIFFLLLLIPLDLAHAGIAAWFIENTLGVLVLWIADALTFILDQLAGVVHFFMLATDVSQVPAITESWKVVRDGVNITFIAVLLVVGIFNIIHYEPDTYALKEYMPNFVIAVIGVNFSKLMCLFILDFVNVLTASIYTFIGGAGQTDKGLGMYGENVGYVVKNLVSWGNIANLSFYNNVNRNGGNSTLTEKAGEDPDGVFSSWDQTIKVFLIIACLVVLILIFLQLIGVFLVRLIKIWVLIVTSPLFFMGLSTQFLSSISDSWWDSFWKYASIPIKVSAFISVGLLMAQKLAQGDGFAGVKKAMLGATATDPAMISNLVSYVIVVGIVVGTIYSALEAASDDGPGSKIGEFLQKPFKGAGSLGLSFLKYAPLVPSLGMLKFTGAGKILTGTHGLLANRKNKVAQFIANKTPFAAVGALGKAISGSPALISAKAYQKAGENISKAIQAQAESKAEDVSGTLAANTFGIAESLSRIPTLGKNGIGSTSLFRSDRIKMRVEIENRKGTRNRAHELEEGLKNLNGHELIDRLKTAKNDDEIQAILGALAHHGEVHGMAETIAKQGIGGQKFENAEALGAYLNERFDEKFYWNHLNQDSMSSLKSNIGKYQYGHMEKLNVIGSVVDQAIAKGLNHDPNFDKAELLSAIGVAIENGKMGPEEVTSLIAYCQSHNILSTQDIGTYNQQSNKLQTIEGVDEQNGIIDIIGKQGIESAIKNKFSDTDVLKNMNIAELEAFIDEIKPRMDKNSRKRLIGFLDDKANRIALMGRYELLEAMKDPSFNEKSSTEKEDIFVKYTLKMMGTDKVKKRMDKSALTPQDHDWGARMQILQSLSVRQKSKEKQSGKDVESKERKLNNYQAAEVYFSNTDELTEEDGIKALINSKQDKIFDLHKAHSKDKYSKLTLKDLQDYVPVNADSSSTKASALVYSQLTDKLLDLIIQGRNIDYVRNFAKQARELLAHDKFGKYKNLTDLLADTDSLNIGNDRIDDLTGMNEVWSQNVKSTKLIEENLARYRTNPEAIKRFLRLSFPMLSAEENSSEVLTVLEAFATANPGLRASMKEALKDESPEYSDKL